MKSIKNFIIYWVYYFKYYFSIKYQLLITNKVSDLYNMKKARLFALTEHHKIRQRYDKKYPYYYHLKLVSDNVLKFCQYESSLNAFYGALFHDLLEDSPYWNYNDLVKIYGIDVAEIVYACTELRGRNRAERHGPEYLQGLKDNKLGLFVKLCDIIANMERGKTTGSSMLKKYQKEYPNTKKELYTEEYKEMFDYIEANLL